MAADYANPHWDGPDLFFDDPRLFWDGAPAAPNNMNTNKISAVLSDADKATALGHIQSNTILLSFLQTLTPEQKKRINNAANGRLPFIQQACLYAQQNPGVLPANFNLPEFVKDVAFITQFVAIVNAEEAFHNKIKGTFTLANSDGYDQALKVYGFFKNANFTGEYNDIVEKLGSYFKGQGPQTPPTPTPPTP